MANERQLTRWQDNLRVTGAAELRNTPDGATIHVRPAAPPPPPDSPPESKGEFIGMCHLMVTQNEDGWDDPGMLTPTV